MKEFAARGYGRRAKEELLTWLLATYSQDCLAQLAPIATDSELASFRTALDRARATLRSGEAMALFLPGLDVRRVLNYRIIKAAGFVFRTPDQRDAFMRQVQRFADATGTGLELLAQRRGYGARREGSVADVASRIYRLILAGEKNFARKLNLHKLTHEMITAAQARRKQLETHKLVYANDHRQKIVFHGDLQTGIVLTRDDLINGNLTPDTIYLCSPDASS